MAAHLSCCAFPPASRLPTLYRQALPALLSFAAAAAQGAHGRVTDISGSPLSTASVTLNGHTKVVLDGDKASFSLILPAGRGHSLRLSLPGYETKEVEFEVRAGVSRRLNVVLDSNRRESDPAKKGGEKVGGGGGEAILAEDMQRYMDEMANK